MVVGRFCQNRSLYRIGTENLVQSEIDGFTVVPLVPWLVGQVIVPVVGKPILDPQCEPIDRRVFRVALPSVHIVNCQDHFFPHQPIEPHKQRSIEELEFVIPEDVKDLWLRGGGVIDKA